MPKDKDSVGKQAEMKVRPLALAGTWYNGSSGELGKEIRGYLDKADVKPMADVSAIIVPHAGHQYSGQGAAYGYKAVSNRAFKRVILMGPNHQSYRFKGIAVTRMTHYQTPLGLVAIDTAACNKLLAAGGIFNNQPDAEMSEHSLEIQLPFIQTVLQGYKLIPLMVDSMSDKDFQTAAEALKEFVDDNTLLIASSDFTHFGEGFGYVPFTDSVKANLKKLDGGAIDQILKISPGGFREYLNATGATICGYNPITLLLHLMPAGIKAQLLDYYTSGDLTGDWGHSVSYAAIAFSRDAASGESHLLDDAEQKFLLKLARQTLQMYLKSGKMPEVDQSKITPRLNRKFGVFVTMEKNKQLRGCIGNFEPVVLYKAVMKQVTESATGDPRFEPMTLAEEPAVHIEISVMSPMKRIDSYKEIIVGTHGVYIKKGMHGATFLPQVAPEQGWDRDTMLEYLCQKAGLDADAYKDKGMEFLVYTAQVFGE
ncbi:MAG: AmmeMemoRadiSam system protein B [Planctomycetota bacterium]